MKSCVLNHGQWLLVCRLLLVAFAFRLTAFAAEEFSSANCPPAYPTTAWVSTDDADLQIMAYDGRRAKVANNHSTRTMTLQNEIQLKRAPSFAIGYVWLHTIEPPHRVTAGSGYAGAVETKVELTSRFGYEDLFIAGLLCDAYFTSTEKPISLPVVTVDLTPVGQVEPNQPQTVTVTVRYRGYANVDPAALQLFVYAGGREVRSNTWRESALLLEKIDRVRHGRAVRRQIDRGRERSLPVTPYAQVQAAPDLPMEYLPPGRHEVPVRFQVKDDGTVSDVEVGAGPPLLRAAVQEAVGHWLFLPAIKDGAPQDTTVKTTVVADGPPAIKS